MPTAKSFLGVGRWGHGVDNQLHRIVGGRLGDVVAASLPEALIPRQILGIDSLSRIFLCFPCSRNTDWELRGCVASAFPPPHAYKLAWRGCADWYSVLCWSDEQGSGWVRCKGFGEGLEPRMPVFARWFR